MSLLLDVPRDLLGVQHPRVWSAPDYVSSSGQEAIELAAMAGLELDEWEQFVLHHALGEREDGKWAAFEVAGLVPRQNGKGAILEARELAGLYILGERLITHTAHLFDTSLEHFTRLLALIEDTPALSKRLKPRGVSRSHGQEGITLKSGQRIRFRTRTKGGGRGFTGDLVVLDEAMEVPEATLNALMPSVAARTMTRTGPQIWYMGSAVDQAVHDNGTVFARLRERGHRGGDRSLAWFEWSAGDDVTKVDSAFTANPEAWAQANPGLGIRISPAYVADERATMSTRGFAVERLCIGDWPRTEDAGDRVIPLELWRATLDPTSAPLDPVTFAFDLTPDRAWASIAVAGRRKDGLPHVEPVERRRGTAWVAPRLAEMVKRARTWQVLCDASGPAGSLFAEVEQVVGKNAKGDSLLQAVSAKEHGQACGVFYDLVTEGGVRHRGARERCEELDAAVDGARRRPLGEAWVWHRRSSEVDISPLVAATLALFGETRRPKARSRVVNLNAI